VPGFEGVHDHHEAKGADPEGGQHARSVAALRREWNGSLSMTSLLSAGLLSSFIAPRS
jgi:hypothetical protein